MLRTIAIATLSVLLAAQHVRADTAAKPCQLQEIASLDITTESGGHISVAGEINGRSGNFLIDTGAISDILSASVAHDLGMRISRANGWMSMLGGIKLNEYVTADTFKIGRLVGERRPFVLAPANLLGQGDIGLIGPSTLVNYDVEIDFAKGKLNLFQPSECSAHPIYWTHDPAAAAPITLDDVRHIVVPVSINGKNVKAIVDTGAGHSIMDIDAASDVMDIDKTDPRFKPLGDVMMNHRAGDEGYKFPFPALTFEGIAVQSPDILIIHDAQMHKGEPTMILGMNILRHLHMYIAYQKRLLFLTGAEAH
jgi:predicted aspartyl protease